VGKKGPAVGYYNMYQEFINGVEGKGTAHRTAVRLIVMYSLQRQCD